MQPTYEKENHRRQIGLFLQLALEAKTRQNNWDSADKKYIYTRERKKKNPQKPAF